MAITNIRLVEVVIYLCIFFPINPEKPEIQIPGKLRAGHPVNISCTTPGNCSSQVDLTWGGVSVVNTSSTTSELTNEIKVYGTFIPSIADHGQNLICNASYNQGTQPVQTEERIQLDVSCE